MNQLRHISSPNSKVLQQILPEAWWTTHPGRSSKLGIQIAGMICEGSWIRIYFSPSQHAASFWAKLAICPSFLDAFGMGKSRSTFSIPLRYGPITICDVLWVDRLIQGGRCSRSHDRCAVCSMGMHGVHIGLDGLDMFETSGY